MTEELPDRRCLWPRARSAVRLDDRPGPVGSLGGRSEGEWRRDRFGPLVGVATLADRLAPGGATASGPLGGLPDTSASGQEPHCRACRAGSAPADSGLRLSAESLTPAAREAVCLAGVLSGFAEAAGITLPKLAGLRPSESTVERATEAAGEDLGGRLAAGRTFGPARDWAWHRDAEGKTCAYVAIDATGVGQQGGGGARADGRMATVAMVYSPVPEARDRRARPDGPAPRFEARYVAGLSGPAPLGEPLRRQAAQVGMDRAERWIAVSDGGAGLEDWVRSNFGRVEAVILDFYHAAEYLGALARALHPADEGAGSWLGDWCGRLKRSGGATVLGELRAGGRRPGRGGARAEAVRYFGNQAHRMDYPAYLAKGWAIGSGPVEAACKTVIGQRMKGSGMRWARRGPTPCATSAPCSGAATGSGTPSGSPPRPELPTKMTLTRWCPLRCPSRSGRSTASGRAVPRPARRSRLGRLPWRRSRPPSPSCPGRWRRWCGSSS